VWRQFHSRTPYHSVLDFRIFRYLADFYPIFWSSEEKKKSRKQKQINSVATPATSNKQQATTNLVFCWTNNDTRVREGGHITDLVYRLYKVFFGGLSSSFALARVRVELAAADLTHSLLKMGSKGKSSTSAHSDATEIIPGVLFLGSARNAKGLFFIVRNKDSWHRILSRWSVHHQVKRAEYSELRSRMQHTDRQTELSILQGGDGRRRRQGRSV